MNSGKLSIKDIQDYVEANIGNFHEARLDGLRKLKLKEILKRKNPYLFKAKDIISAHELVKLLLDAYLSSQEETLFGNFLEKLAIYICGKVYGGKKSNRRSIDLEFIRNNTYYLVSIKSGPNWGNSDQIKKMRENFKQAIQDIQNDPKIPRGITIVAVNGCCYGKDDKPYKGDYFKYCGQDFWELISGMAELYTLIIEPLGFKAKEKNEEYLKKYNAIITNFTVEFANEFCKNGMIDWVKLVKFNSGRKEN